MIKSNNLSLDVQSHLPPISPPCRSPLEGKLPSAKYTKLSEILRKTTNSQLQCSMFCGGKNCKFEKPSNWSNEEKAIPGLYSHWVTEDILAMARPNNDIIKEYNLIQIFKDKNIKTIINLQEPGEHSSCGPPLDSSFKFSYSPKLFMDNQIFFNNFPWKDYSGVSPAVLLDIVKVVTFAVTQGNIAIHCHAGLGRTGVLIAGYLIFTYRCDAPSAIAFVRLRRPNSIQSRGQILSLFKFANYISPCFIVYKSVSSKQISVTLTDFLQRQRVLLHGFELRCLRYIPKIVFIICEKLIKIAGKASILKIRECDHEDDLNEYNFTRHYLSSRKCKDVQSKAHSEESDSESEGDEDSKDDEHDSMETFDPDYNLQYEIDNFEVDTEKENEEEKKLIDLLDEPNGVKEMDFLKPETLARHRPSFQVLQQSLLDNIECTAPPEVIITVLTCEPKTDNDFNQTIYNYQKAINNTPNGWEKLCEERDLETLVTLLWTWFENLDSPILNTETLGLIAETKEDFEKCFFSMNMETRFTLEYLVRFVMRLCEDQEEGKRRVLARLVAALTIKRVQMDGGESIPRQKQTWLALSSRSREAVFNLIHSLMQLIESNTLPL